MSSLPKDFSPVAHGVPCWSYIPAYNVQRAQEFYRTLFNWSFRPGCADTPEDQQSFLHVLLPDSRMETMGIGGGIMKVQEGTWTSPDPPLPFHPTPSTYIEGETLPPAQSSPRAGFDARH